MPTSRGRAGDFGPGLFDVLGSAAGVLSLARRAAWLTAAVHRSGAAPWQRGCAGPKGPGFWGGSGGPWGTWWPGPAGPQGPSRGTKAGRGDVRAAILALLREGPRTGYQIMSDIEERSGGAWRPSPGAVYPALAQLSDEGLITGVESGGRRTFRLTEAGQRHIADNPETARPAWESMAEGPPGEVRGLLTQAARLGGSVAQIAHAGTPEQIRAAGELLAATRRGIYQILAGDGDEYAADDDEGDTGYAGDEDGGQDADYAGADLAGAQDDAEKDEGTGHG